MKHAWVVVFAAAVAGCQTGGGRADDQPVTKRDLTDAELKCKEEADRAFAHHKQMTETIGRLEGRMSTLERRAETQEIEIRSLNDRLARAGAGANPTDPPPTVPPVPAEDAIKEVDNQLTRLKNGLPVDGVAKVLAPLAKYAAPKLCETLKNAFRDVELMGRVEQVLERLPAAELRYPLEDSLRDRVARYPAARVVGRVGNRELSKVLEAYTADADLYFCYLVGDSLTKCRNRSGVPALIRVLRSEDKNTRFLAISALRALANENTHNYDFTKTPEQNMAAIKLWEEWWDKSGAKLFE